MLRRSRRLPTGDAAATTVQRVYDAFVSYNRAADGKLAPALQRGLQQFAKPWYRLRALRIFRDDASLAANPNLWSSIEQALDRSGFFILLASPESAASKWVAKEVQYWLEHRESDRLLVAVTDGELVWGANGGLDEARTNAVPPPLRGVFTEEPRYVDLRWARSEAQLSRRDARFRSALADLAAPLHGRSKDEMLGEDVRQHRRAIRLAWASGILLALLAAGASVAAVLAVQARDRARTEAATALSRQLAAQSVARLPGATALSPLLGLEALRLVDGAPGRAFDARDAVLRAVERSPRLVATLPVTGTNAMAFAPGGRTLVTGGAKGALSSWAAGDGEPLGRSPAEHGSDITSVAFSPDGSTLASGGKDGKVRFWDARSLRPLGPPLRGHEVLIEGTVNSLAFSPNGSRLVSGALDGRVLLWDVRRRRLLGALGKHEEQVLHVAFAAGGRTVVSTDFGATTKVWDLARRPRLRRTVTRGDGFAPVGFSGDGRLFASTFDGLEVWSILGRRPLGDPLSPRSGDYSSVAFSRDDRIVAAATIRAIELRDGRTGKLIDRLPLEPNEGIDDITFARGRAVLASLANGTVRLWDTRRAKPLSRILRPARPSLGGTRAVASGGETLAATNEQTLTLWHPREDSVATSTRRARSAVAVGVAADGRTIATGAVDGTVTLWDGRGSRLGSFHTRLPGGVASVAFADHDKQVVVRAAQKLAAGRFEFWDVDKRERLADVRLGVPVTCPNGGDDNPKVAMCRETVVVSPDRTIAAVFGSRPDVTLWDVRQNQSIGVLSVPTESVNALAFSPDHQTLVTVGTALTLWDVPRRQPLGRPLEPSRAPMASVALSPSGSELVTGSYDDSAAIWDELLLSSDYDAWRARLCRIAGRNLTRDEWTEFLPGQRYHVTCPEFR